MNDPIENSKYIITDILSGDPNASKTEAFQNYDKKQIERGFELIMSNPNLTDIQKKFFLNNSWQIYYKVKPPSIREFLTPEWLGPSANELYPHVRATLEDFFSPSQNKRHLILGTSIGTGKSSMAIIATLYTVVHVVLMKNPIQFFSLMSMAPIVAMLISFTEKKVKQLYGKPFETLLIQSPKFKRIMQEGYLLRKQDEIGLHNQICWTSASKMGGLASFPNQMHLLYASDPANLLGLNILLAVMSELSFFIERGVSPDEIWRVYNDSKGRIFSRFGNRYFANTIMDSSPNDYELPVDKYVFSGEAAKDPLNYVITGSQWEFEGLHKNYPIWVKTKETFPVFRGSATQLPKIIGNEEDRKNYDPALIKDVPIDVQKFFIQDIRKATKDYIGWPAGGTNKLIEDTRYVDELFDSRLINHETYIYAPSDKQPEKLIWDQVKDIFFIKIDNRYEFYRYPLVPRYIHFDLSETGDLTAIGMCHAETFNGDIIVVNDFTIVISPGKGRINIDAVYCFITDLRKEGHINIQSVTADRYQSSAIIERLKRDEFNAKKLSVDESTEPYYMLTSYIKTGRFKAGKNFFLKGNLLSLVEVRTEKGRKKIDHTIGKISYDLDEINLNWQTSLLGRNGKDASDASCGSFYTCIMNTVSPPAAIWINSNEVLGNSLMSVKDKIFKKFKLKVAEVAEVA